MLPCMDCKDYMSGAYKATIYPLLPAKMTRRPSTSCRVPSKDASLPLKMHSFRCSHITQSTAQTPRTMLPDLCISQQNSKISGTGGLGGPAVHGTLATDLEKPHSVEDPGLPLASPSSAVDDEIPSTTNGPQLFSSMRDVRSNIGRLRPSLRQVPCCSSSLDVDQSCRPKLSSLEDFWRSMANSPCRRGAE